MFTWIDSIFGTLIFGFYFTHLLLRNSFSKRVNSKNDEPRSIVVIWKEHCTTGRTKCGARSTSSQNLRVWDATEQSHPEGLNLSRITKNYPIFAIDDYCS